MSNLFSSSGFSNSGPRAAQRQRRGPDVNAAGRTLLDRTHAQLMDGDIGGMDDFVVSLKAIRDRLAPPQWRRFVGDVVAPHHVRALIHEEPLTRRAYEKPRGYPGDAALLDLIYSDRPYQGDLSPIGARLHAWAVTQPGFESVKARRQILAEIIDQIALERPNPRILSVACGHLREAQVSEAVQRGAVDEIVALDQDAESLALVAREQSHRGVSPVNASIRQLAVAPTQYGSFDFVYAAGLYDYLSEAFAQSLTGALFRALRPGGTLLVANFAPELRENGYMEAIMDWNLIFRNEDAVQQFAAGIDPDAVQSQRLFRDAPGNVVYLQVTRR